MALDTTITETIQSTLSGTAVLSATPGVVLSKAYIADWDTGVAVDTADKIYFASRTLASSATESLDLSGALVDALGSTISFARVKAVIIKNTSTVAGENLLVGGAASNAWETWTTVAGSKIKVGPNGRFSLINPSLAAYAVTAGTGDLLKIANAGAASITYEVIIIGCSA